MSSRDDKLSNKPKMSSITSILTIWRSVEKYPKNYLPLKKSFFGHFSTKINDLKIFFVSLHIFTYDDLIVHRIRRRSVKKLGPYH